ncbi:hypothetical protein TNIN_121911 [Trichonephila inaurata madagascariensis]|uniref:Uncharacterized protein n=1 Tax=Trichonephila inaurata madagascariensis TaxID=2747483 RepID=A0A8X7BPV9_9ARAC|nr:hypothetical protein TNIN_121911 [Trichonephila inaurata madagascariensis]
MNLGSDFHLSSRRRRSSLPKQETEFCLHPLQWCPIEQLAICTSLTSTIVWPRGGGRVEHPVQESMASKPLNWAFSFRSENYNSTDRFFIKEERSRSRHERETAAD